MSQLPGLHTTTSQVKIKMKRYSQRSCDSQWSRNYASVVVFILFLGLSDGIQIYRSLDPEFQSPLSSAPGGESLATLPEKKLRQELNITSFKLKDWSANNDSNTKLVISTAALSPQADYPNAGPKINPRKIRDFPHEFDAASHRRGQYREAYGYDPASPRESLYQNQKIDRQSEQSRQRESYRDWTESNHAGIRSYGNPQTYETSHGPLDETIVKITKLDVPAIVKNGEDVDLRCHFELLGKKNKLYTVNWWRGANQFYNYKANKKGPKSAYTFDGISVDEELSTSSTVRLRNVSEKTSGTYKCEVMAEGPAFKTAVEKQTMTVIVPPEVVRIKTLWDGLASHMYRVDDLVDLNCTAIGAKPRADLSWEMNGRPLNDLDSLPFPDYEDQNGRVTSSIGLKFLAPKYFEDLTATVTCVANVAGYRTTEDRKLYLDSSATYHHIFARACGLEMAIQWLLFTALVHLALL